MTTFEETSEAYPRGGMCMCVVFQLMFILYMLFVSYGLILFTYILVGILAVRGAESKLRKCKSSYYKARVYTSPKNKTRLEIKCEK